MAKAAEQSDAPQRRRLPSSIAWASALSVGAFLLSSAACADGYPARPIVGIVPFPAGGALDFIARLLADDMGKQLGQPIVIDNRSGAGGTLGTTIAMRAQPDGYTLLFTVNPTMTTNPFLQSNVPYNVKSSFAPIGLMAEGLVLIAVHPSLPIEKVQDLVAYARSHPGKLSYGTPGVGGGLHLVMELLRRETGIDIVHVPYRGTAGLVQDAVAGNIQIVLAASAAILPFAQSGQLRVIGVTEPKRSPELPNLPAINEAYPSAQYFTWYGLYGPAKLPQPIVDTLSRALTTAVANPNYSAKLKPQGLFARSSTPEELQRLGSEEFDYFARLIPSLGLKRQ